MTEKQINIGIGLAVVAVGGYFLYNKYKQPSFEQQNTPIENQPLPQQQEVPQQQQEESPQQQEENQQQQEENPQQEESPHGGGGGGGGGGGSLPPEPPKDKTLPTNNSESKTLTSTSTLDSLIPQTGVRGNVGETLGAFVPRIKTARPINFAPRTNFSPKVNFAPRATSYAPKSTMRRR